MIQFSIKVLWFTLFTLREKVVLIANESNITVQFSSDFSFAFDAVDVPDNVDGVRMSVS